MKVSPRPDRTATLKQILVFYDEPQLALLRTDRDLDMLAVAVDDNNTGLYPFFACSITKKTLDKYIDGRNDLNYVFRNPDYGLYMFDWREMNDNFVVPVRRARNSEVMNDDLYPEIGFFSRSHTYTLSTQRQEDGAVTHQFSIDGSWQAQEFSKFYSQISDLYAFYLVAANIEGDKVENAEFAFARDSVNKHFWRGGGSYVQFFHELSEHTEGANPLKVTKIAYASPGNIDLLGHDATLSELEQLIYLIGANHIELAKLYNQIDKVLGSQRLKAAGPDAEFSGPSIADFVFMKTKELATGLNLSNSDRLYAMCSGNKVLFAKVVLALYRRARGLYLFHAQGRVQPQHRLVDEI